MYFTCFILFAVYAELKEESLEGTGTYGSGRIFFVTMCFCFQMGGGRGGNEIMVSTKLKN